MGNGNQKPGIFERVPVTAKLGAPQDEALRNFFDARSASCRHRPQELFGFGGSHITPLHSYFTAEQPVAFGRFEMSHLQQSKRGKVAIKDFSGLSKAKIIRRETVRCAATLAAPSSPAIRLTARAPFFYDVGAGPSNQTLAPETTRFAQS